MARRQHATKKIDTQLDLPAIVDAARKVVRRQGARKLTMRGLARELGVSPMAIYHHVESKDALLEKLGPKGLELVAGGKGSGKNAHLLREPEIIDAAMKLLRESGIEQFSMRALARQLGVSPMALYHYVPSREELLDKVRETLLSQVPSPPVRPDDWEAQLRAYALQSLLLFAEYPGLEAFASQRAPIPSDRRLGRHGIEILLAAGCDARTAALALSTYHTHIFGQAMLWSRVRVMQAKAKGRARADAKAKSDAAPRGSSGDDKPVLADVARQLGGLGFREAIEFGLDTILRGLRLQIETANSKKER